MRTQALGVLLCGLAAAAAAAAEAPPGRRARIHMQDGNVLTCLVRGCADGKLDCLVAGRPQPIELAAVAKVEFGEAVGDQVRRSEPPEPPGDDGLDLPTPTTGPGSARAQEFFEHLGRVRTFCATADERKLLDLVGYNTARFENRLALGMLQALVKNGLAKVPRKGTVERNLKLMLAMVKAAQALHLERLSGVARPDRMRLLRARQHLRHLDEQLDDILSRLRADYPRDPEVKDLTPATLKQHITRWRKSAPQAAPAWVERLRFRPEPPDRSPPRRGPERRPGLQPRRRTPPPRH
jgi:hypothetical protein